MTDTRCDIFVSGAGIAGLVAAAAFGRAGFRVVVADPAPPAATDAQPGADLRSTAYLRPAQALIGSAGLWQALEAEATPLETLRAIDTTGWPPEVRATRDFRADDLGDGPFGWNLPNWLTRHVLAGAVADLPHVDLRLGTGFRSLLSREREALVTLTDGARLRARLVIAADGRTSPVREAAGIGLQVARYGQKALAFSAAHDLPHGNISTEIYNQGGAFTLVPMNDVDGRPASAVVWMNDGAKAAEIAALPEDRFNDVMTARSTGVLGRLERLTAPQIWPVVTQRAERLTAERVALVAEAAHVLPPIGAQGLNTSLRDVAVLLDLAEADPAGLGGPAMLDAYAKAREGDLRARATAIDLFNRVCKSGNPAVQSLRLAGLRAVHDIRPLRQAVMKAGLGAQST